MAGFRRKASGWGARARQQSFTDPYSVSMLQAGRRPSMNGGWKSRPGATQAWRDAREPMPGDAMRGSGGLTDQNTWDSFFGKKSAPVVPQAEWATPANFGPTLAPDNPSSAIDMGAATWNNDAPLPSNPSSYVQATAQSAARYFDEAGSPVPSATPGTFNAQLYNQPFGATPELYQEDDVLDMADEYFGM